MGRRSAADTTSRGCRRRRPARRCAVTEARTRRSAGSRRHARSRGSPAPPPAFPPAQRAHPEQLSHLVEVISRTGTVAGRPGRHSPVVQRGGIGRVELDGASGMSLRARGVTAARQQGGQRGVGARGAIVSSRRCSRSRQRAAVVAAAGAHRRRQEEPFGILRESARSASARADASGALRSKPHRSRSRDWLRACRGRRSRSAVAGTLAVPVAAVAGAAFAGSGIAPQCSRERSGD